MAVWLVRAGSQGEYEERFLSSSRIYVTWDNLHLDLKKIVDDLILQKLDHQLVLSETYLKANPAFKASENLVEWTMEPSVENILLFIRGQLQLHFPKEIQLLKLKLFETADSYAEWGNSL